MKIGIFCVFILFACVAGVATALTLPGDNTISQATGDQQSPSISKGSNSVLAVWSDSRANPYGFYEYETGKDIYGLRLDVSGNPLDPLPIPLVVRRANQENPRVAWNGTNWIVVYESHDVGGTGYYYQKSLEAIRVSPAGQVLDNSPIKLYGLTPSGSSWTISSDGNHWVVVNQGTSATGDIVVVRISASGQVLDPPTKALVKASYYGRSNFNLAYAGGVFLFTFDDEYVNGLYTTSAVRFDSNLNLFDSVPIFFLNGSVAELAGNSTQFFAVWNQQLADYSMAVTGSRVNTDGQKLDGNGKNISGNFPNTAYSRIGVVWDGFNWKVTWGYNNSVRAARVNTSGVVLDPGGVSVTGPQTGPATGTGNGGVQFVWTVNGNSNYDVQSANVSSGNVAGPNRNLSLSTPQQLRADVAASGNGYMMVFRSNISGQIRILAQPLDAAGNAITQQPIQLDTGGNTAGPGLPNVAWNGSLFLVSWSNASGVVAQRLSANGAKVDSAPFVVMNPAFGPADVAALGSDFLVTARKYGYSPQFIYAIGARVRGNDGSVADTVPLSFNSVYARTPAVTTVGGRWLVAYHSNWTHDEPNADTLGAFVSASGVVTNFHIHGPFSTAGGNGIFEVGLGSNGNVALFAQSQELTSGVETDLLVRTINSSGTVGPLVNLTPWVGNQYRPRISWDGSHFVVVYQEQKNRLALHTLDQLDARSDLFGMRVSVLGVKLDPQGFVFSALPTSETDPTVVSLNGISVLAGSTIINNANLASYRIVYNLFGSGGNKWPVAAINANTISGDISLTVNFNSSGTVDPDGSIASYLWKFGDGFTSSVANPSHTFASAGEWLVTLTVTDNQGAQTTQAQMIEASVPNQNPVAVASADKTSGSAPLDVILYADGSYDPDGFTGNLEWLFDDGQTYYGSPAYHTFYTTGNHTVTLRVYDSRGSTGTTSIAVNVTGLNKPPVANAGATPTSGSVPLTVAFTSAGSTDPDGSIKSYYWDFGNAIGFSNAANPTYVYQYTGTYTATLTVTDNNNQSSSDSVVIVVNQSSSTILRSTAIDLTATARGKKVNVSGKITVRYGNNTAASGATVTVRWTKPGGAIATQSAITNTSGVASFSTSGGPGTYNLTVTNITKSGCTFDSANSVLNKSIIK